MKLFIPILIGIFAQSSLGGLLPSTDQKPIKFLVLQRSDVVGEAGIKSFENQTIEKPSDIAGVTTEETLNDAKEDALGTTEDVIVADAVPENIVDEQSAENPAVEKFWDPANGWKELKFPIFPEGDGEFQPLPAENVSIVDISQPEVKSVTYVQGLQRIACQCGNSSGRIVGGDPARINTIPWTVALVRNGFFGFGASKKPYCGGTLINDLYVATASHCVDGSFAAGLKVWINEEDYLISGDASSRKEFLVEEIIMHPEYDRRTVNNDIALLKLAKSVPIGPSESFIVPACLPTNNNHDFAGQMATVAGWGLTSDGGSQSTVLRKVKVPIMPNSKCNSDETKYKGKISENMLCAGFDEGGKDSCQGDSGGPLIIDNSGRSTLVGIVSWGFGCAQPNSPGVYTRVAKYPSWILANTKGAHWCSD